MSKKKKPEWVAHEWVAIHKAYQCKHCPAIYPTSESCAGKKR